MSSLVEVLVDHLLANTPLTAQIGQRLDPDFKEQDSPLPAVTYRQISSAPVQHRSSRKPSYSRTRMQFDVWAADKATVITVRNLLRTAMSTLDTTSPLRVDGALMQDDRDAYEADPGVYRAILDYFVWHKEAA